MCKLVIVSGILMAMTATVFCYNFEDPYYNQILATDLEEMQDSLDYSSIVEHPRARRDEEAVGSSDKCRRRRFKKCCDVDSMENLYYQEGQLRKECYKEIYGKDKDVDTASPDPFKCDKVNKRRENVTCYLQCISQKKNLTGSDGNIIEEQFRVHFLDNFKQTWLVPHLDTIISKCLAEARNATASHTKRDTDSCNPATIKVAHCISTEMQMKCPEDQIKDTKACAKFKEKIKKSEEYVSALQSIEQ